MISYKAIEKHVVFLGRKKPVLTTEVFILKCSDKNNEVWIPSPLTYFIYHKYTAKSCSNNTKMQSALALCNFLNYINKQVILGEDPCFYKLKDGGLHSIKFIHLAKYLNYISQKGSKKTVIKQ